MDIALLNQRITVQKNTPYADEIGNRLLRWEDYYACACTVSGESGSENAVAGTTVDGTKVNFTVRWCQLASAITNTEYRVLFNSEVYDILAVDHMAYKHKTIKLKCQKVRR